MFITALLMGIYYATAVMDTDRDISLLVRRLAQTLGLFVWVGAAYRVCRPILDAFARLADRVQWIESRRCR